MGWTLRNGKSRKSGSHAWRSALARRSSSSNASESWARHPGASDGGRRSLVVDDPHSSLVSGETTVVDTLPPFDSDAFSSLHASVASTLDPMEELSEADDL